MAASAIVFLCNIASRRPMILQNAGAWAGVGFGKKRNIGRNTYEIFSTLARSPCDLKFRPRIRGGPSRTGSGCWNGMLPLERRGCARR